MRRCAGGLLAAALLFAGCGVSTRRAGSPVRLAPPETQSWQNPYEGQAWAVRAGEKLFRQHCAECHGADARGTARGPSLRVPAVREAAPGQLFWFLRHGDLPAGMPAWSGLPEQRRWQIVTYLKSLD